MSDDVGRRVAVVYDPEIDWHDQPSRTHKSDVSEGLPRAKSPWSETTSSTTPGRGGRVTVTLPREPEAIALANAKALADAEQARMRRQGWSMVAFGGIAAALGIGRENTMAVGGLIFVLVLAIAITAGALFAVRGLAVWFLRPIAGLFRQR